MRETAFILPKNGPREVIIQKIASYLGSLSMAQAWKLKVSVNRSQRSDDQNAALWGCAYKYLREETGNDPDQMHEYFCINYWGKVERNVFGMRKMYPRRTTTTDENGNRDVISTLEFMRFYEFIQQHMVEKLGLNVPDPDPFWKEKLRSAA